MKKSATIKDVAKYAGASIGTVSNVLNGLRCGENLRKRIQKAITELEYTPNMHAKAVRSSRTDCIGILIEKGTSTDTPWIQSLLMELIKEISGNRFRSLFEYWDGKRGGAPQILGSVDGIISIGSVDDYFSKLSNSHKSVPLVTYWEETLYEKGISIPVEIDSGIRNAVEHLLLLGHQRIGYIGDRSNEVSRKKFVAFKAALRLYGRDVGEKDAVFVDDIDGDHTDRGFEATKTICATDVRPPTALFYASDCYAIGGVGALTEAGLRIPNDISVISFDDSYWARSNRPAITSLGFLDSLSRRMVETLMNSMRFNDVNSLRENLESLRLEFNIRESTAAAKAPSNQRIQKD